MKVLPYLQALLELGLLLVYDAQSEVDFIGLLKVGLDRHDLGEGFLGIIVAPVSIIQDSDPVPQHRILRAPRLIDYPRRGRLSSASPTYLGIS